MILEADRYDDDRDLIEQFLNIINYRENINKVIHFDIECDTYAKFPVPETNAIIAIGIEIEPLPQDLRLEHECQILHGYNIMGFDLDYIIKRMEINGQDPHRLSLGGPLEWKDTETVYLMNIPRTIPKIRSKHRYFYDSYICGAGRDQRLTDLKSRSLEDVSKHYKPDLNVITMPRSAYLNFRKLVRTDTLIEYLESDMRCTRVMWNTYFRNRVVVANILDIPIEKMIYMGESYPGHKMCKDISTRQGLKWDGTNTDRYGDNAKQKTICYH